MHTLLQARWVAQLAEHPPLERRSQVRVPAVSVLGVKSTRKIIVLGRIGV